MCEWSKPGVVYVAFLLATVLLISSSAEEGAECAHTIACGAGHKDKKDTLLCPSSTSLILVTNVTSATGEEDGVMLTRVKRSCMGQRSCNVSTHCARGPGGSLQTIHFLCVHAPRSEQRECTGRPVPVSDPHGFLQNPEYPAPGHFSPCHWQIQPQHQGQAVHLALHDLDSAHRTGSGVCNDGGLQIRASKCNTKRPRQVTTELLCTTSRPDVAEGDEGGDGGGSGSLAMASGIVSCGMVEIKLIRGRHLYPLRFWLGFVVRDIGGSEPFSRSLHTAGLLSSCPAKDHRWESSSVQSTPDAMSTTAHYNQSVTSASGVSGDADHQDNTMTVLIVLVCVIGFIALVLSIVLTIVCLKRRRPKVELIEHVYAVPSTCASLSHTRLADDLKPEPVPRPQVRVVAYSDVVDARPPGQPLLVTTPASPPYAEVEDCPPSRAFDGRTWPRFHFRSAHAASSRPSLSSSDASSTHYEDVSPVPVSLPSSTSARSQPASSTASKSSSIIANSTPKAAAISTNDKDLPKLSVWSIKTKSELSANRKSNGFSTAVNVGSTGNRNDINYDRKWGTLVGTNSAGSKKDAPVYVHVVDSVDSKTNRSKKSTPAKSASAKTQTDKSAIAPLAAKFDGRADDSPRDKVSAHKTAVKSEPPYSSRLYPLQEGRVASLVSTLNRTKEGTNGDDGFKELTATKVT